MPHSGKARKDEGWNTMTKMFRERRSPWLPVLGIQGFSYENKMLHLERNLSGLRLREQ